MHVNLPAFRRPRSRPMAAYPSRQPRSAFAALSPNSARSIADAADSDIYRRDRRVIAAEGQTRHALPTGSRPRRPDR
jgi:hypothetical protein